MKLIALSSALVLAIGCGGSGAKPATTPAPTETADTVPEEPKPAPPPPRDIGPYKLTAPADLAYAPLDPSQPDGVQAAVVHGDLASGGAFFLKIPAGANTGLHTHTADYHAVVVSGKPRHWLPGAEKKAKVVDPGSYWFQPGGQPHGDACTGDEPCVLFLTMGAGFDYTPTPKAKKVAAGKYAMVERKNAKLAPLDPSQPDGAKWAVLSGDPQAGPVAFLLQIPAGGDAGVHSHTSDYHAVVIDGGATHWLPGDEGDGGTRAAGTHWFQPGGYDHGDRCTGDAPCHLVVFMDKGFDFKPAAAK